MATFKIIIKKAKREPVILDDGTVTIYIKYTHFEKSSLFSTGVRVSYEDWQDDQRYPVKGVGKESKNRRINQFKSYLEKLVGDLIQKGVEPTTKNLKAINAHQQEQAKQKEEQEIRKKTEENVILQYNKFLEYSLTCKEKSTVRTLAITKHKLQKFMAYHKIKTLSVLEIDLSFYDKFKKFLSEKEGNSDHTIGNRIISLKNFLHWYEDRGGKVHLDTKRRAFKAFRETQPVPIYLTKDELETFANVDFQEEHFKWVQDYFVFQCNTGLRIGDMLLLRPHHIKGDVIEMISEKTSKRIFVPLTPKAKEILSKYDNRLPKKLKHRYNLYIKDALKIAGIDSLVEIRRKFQGKDQTITVPKYEAISSHNAVKTFITLALQAGISPKTVAEITGKTVAVIIKHYYGSNEDQLKAEMAKAFG
ncbi:integrase [Catalinimonas alkaloidigena]|uniref:tyrosine-type recombinase/integrase n=1 Tax=Catalinimonas alkaloidigena TaxID=1075417 RepID=UPI00240497FD|nr:tyrosine-type recombinase/integrase [Catalinimonas alkaloidigena]MDF9800562.1 integrase [Catalinimonas alkaloidigena]